MCRVNISGSLCVSANFLLAVQMNHCWFVFICRHARKHIEHLLKLSVNAIYFGMSLFHVENVSLLIRCPHRPNLAMFFPWFFWEHEWLRSSFTLIFASLKYAFLYSYFDTLTTAAASSIADITYEAKLLGMATRQIFKNVQRSSLAALNSLSTSPV